MPTKELLGSDEAFYFKSLPDIIPHLKDLRERDPKKYAQYGKRLLNIKPEIDEDIDAIAHRLLAPVGAQFEKEKREEVPGRGFVQYKELTNYGLLRKDVNRAYKRGIQEGLIRYARGVTKEKIVLWLFLSLGENYTNEVAQIVLHLRLDEIQSAFKADAYLRKRVAKKEGVPYAYDEYKYLVFDEDRWFQSFTKELRFAVNIIKPVELNALISYLALEEKGKAFSQKVKEKNIPTKNWLELCGWIYIIRCLGKKKLFMIEKNPELWKLIVEDETIKNNPKLRKQLLDNWKKMEDCDILRSDLELRKIWGIPRDTYRRRMEFLARLDADT
jgi:hypothetical protein